MQEDLRFKTPLYTVQEASWYLDLPRQTFRYWATQQGQFKPLVTAYFHGRRREATVPFIGFVEAFVVQAFRRVSGIKMPYLRRVLDKLDRAIGVHNALASRRLFVHGGQILYDFAAGRTETRELAEVLTENRVFEKVVEGHLSLITYGDDWATKFQLPFLTSRRPLVEVDPLRAAGQPILKGGARLVDVLDRLEAGEHPDVVAEDFRVSREDVLEIVRALARKAREPAA